VRKYMYILTLDLVFSSISVRAPDPTSDSLALFWVSPFFAFGVDPSTPKKSNSRLEENWQKSGRMAESANKPCSALLKEVWTMKEMFTNCRV